MRVQQSQVRLLELVSQAVRRVDCGFLSIRKPCCCGSGRAKRQLYLGDTAEAWMEGAKMGKEWVWTQ